MNGTISVDLSSYNNAAGEIKKIATQVNDLVYRIKQVPFNGGQQSRGHCSRKMEMLSQQELLKAAQNCYNLMEKTAKLLNAAANKYQSTDQQIADQY